MLAASRNNITNKLLLLILLLLLLPGPSRARVRPGENTTSLQLEVLTAEKNSLPHSAGPPEYRGARGSFPLLSPLSTVLRASKLSSGR